MVSLILNQSWDLLRKGKEYRFSYEFLFIGLFVTAVGIYTLWSNACLLSARGPVFRLAHLVNWFYAFGFYKSPSFGYKIMVFKIRFLYFYQ